MDILQVIKDNYLNWQTLINLLFISLIVFISQQKKVQMFVGEYPGITTRSKRHSIINIILIIILIIPFSFYFLLGEVYSEQIQISYISLPSILPIVSALGALVLTAAPKLANTPQTRIKLKGIAQKFILATILFLIFAPCLFMIDGPLGGIDINSLDSDPISIFRGVLFWVFVTPSFYGGITLFIWGLLDLVYDLAFI